MISLSIDIQDLANEFALSRSEIDSVLKNCVEEVTAQFAREWDNQARQGLTKSRELYRSAIQVEKIDDLTGAVFLDPKNWLANAVEGGCGEFDMKEYFGKSSKRTIKGDGKGWFLTIPFRFATPSAIGDNPAFAGVMPLEIHAAVLNQEKQEPEKKGLSMENIPSQYHIPQSSSMRRVLSENSLSKIPVGTAMTSIYAGLQRNSLGAGYVMFRRVSDNSESDKFIHPGITARNLMDIALKNIDIDKIVDISIDNSLASFGF